jgi:hypothetical protein
LTVYGFYKRRRAAFFSMIGLDLAAHVTSVVEVYVTLRMLGAVPTMGGSYIIESLTKVINFAFGFVPGTIGVYETGNGIILRTLGYTTAIGVALAIVRKAAIIFWTVIAPADRYPAHSAECRSRVLDRSPRLRKLWIVLPFQSLLTGPRAPAVSIAGIALGVLLVVFTVGLAHGLCANAANAKLYRRANTFASGRFDQYRRRPVIYYSHGPRGRDSPHFGRPPGGAYRTTSG